MLHEEKMLSREPEPEGFQKPEAGAGPGQTNRTHFAALVTERYPVSNSYIFVYGGLQGKGFLKIGGFFFQFFVVVKASVSDQHSLLYIYIWIWIWIQGVQN